VGISSRNVHSDCTAHYYRQLAIRTLEEGIHFAAVFFDLHKAFNSVPHKTQIDKHEQTGVTGLQIFPPTGSKE